MQPKKMTRVIGRMRYRVEESTLLASDAYWDGHNWERHGRNIFLYRTPKGNYFATHLSQWQGEQDRLEPLDVEQAMTLYENLPVQEVSFEEAFAGVGVEDA